MPNSPGSVAIMLTKVSTPHIALAAASTQRQRQEANPQARPCSLLAQQSEVATQHMLLLASLTLLCTRHTTTDMLRTVVAPLVFCDTNPVCFLLLCTCAAVLSKSPHHLRLHLEMQQPSLGHKAPIHDFPPHTYSAANKSAPYIWLWPANIQQLCAALT
jgi:hypothetical protein